MSPRPFHGARQIGGKESPRSAARSPLGARRGVTSPRTAAGCDFPKDGGLTRRGQRKLPKPSAAFSLKLAWRQTAPLPEHRFATRYRSGDMRSVSRRWRGVSPPGLCPCRANAVLCVTRCAADWCGLAWRVAAHNNGGEAPFKENYALLKKLSEM